MAGGVVANQINTDFGVFQNNNAYLGMAKAWVQFVGSSATINGSFNVSSITRSGTGLYTVNFTTAMPNANYAAVISNSSASGSSQTNSQVFSSSGANVVAPTTTAFSFSCSVAYTGGFWDPNYACAVVYSS